MALRRTSTSMRVAINLNNEDFLVKYGNGLGHLWRYSLCGKYYILINDRLDLFFLYFHEKAPFPETLSKGKFKNRYFSPVDSRCKRHSFLRSALMADHSFLTFSYIFIYSFICNHRTFNGIEHTFETQGQDPFVECTK